MKTDDVTPTSDQVRKVAETLKKLRPAYAALLDFHKQIFSAQEESRSQLDIKPIQIPKESLFIKAKEKLPLINMSEFVIDTEEATKLFRKICSIAEGANEVMAMSARGIIKAIETGELDLNTLLSKILVEDDILFEKIAGEFEIDRKVLAFITYNSIKPSLSVCASQLSTYLDKNKSWEMGYCPICGSLPVLSTFENEGKRFLFCSFCWHKWPVQRIYCPFCNNKDNTTLHYFQIEEEQEYRLDVCDNCEKYIKAVDTREIERIFYPPLEEVATLHLDIKAKEMGFEGGGVQTDLCA